MLERFLDPDRWASGWFLFKIWLFNILVALDQLANAIFFGDPDETVSSRAGKAKRAGKCWGCFLCKILDWIDPHHCRWSEEKDEGEYSVFKRALSIRQRLKGSK